MSRTIDMIVIHCSATRCDRDISGAQIDAAHRVRGYSCAGYHYYIRKSGKIEALRSLDIPGAHAFGYNVRSIGICYEGGLDENGRPCDTRTADQKLALHRLVARLKTRFTAIDKVVGHRDLSPDKNGNGVVDAWERIKECPCFEVSAEFGKIGM